MWVMHRVDMSGHCEILNIVNARMNIAESWQYVYKPKVGMGRLWKVE